LLRSRRKRQRKQHAADKHTKPMNRGTGDSHIEKHCIRPTLRNSPETPAREAIKCSENALTLHVFEPTSSGFLGLSSLPALRDRSACARNDRVRSSGSCNHSRRWLRLIHWIPAWQREALLSEYC